MNIIDKFEEALNTFKTSGSAESSLFAYWNNFLSNMAPVLWDLTRSFRDADWYLHLSSISRAVDLCFSFDHINYKRWLHIYYENFLPLPKRFAKTYQSFLNGDFVVKHSSRKNNAVPMDQALENSYNKPVQSSAGIIGFTWRKEVVCKWNLIKHEKAKYQNFMDIVSCVDEDDKYSLHYEFSDRITKADNHSAAALMKSLLQRGKPFYLEQPRV